MNSILIIIGLLVAFLGTCVAVADIRDRRPIIVVCVGLGLTAFGLANCFSLFAGSPAIVVGLATFGISLLASCETFKEGQVAIFQPVFRFGKTVIDPTEWLLLMPGFRIIWRAVTQPVANVHLGKIVIDDGEADVRFGEKKKSEGQGFVRWRFNASPPLDPSVAARRLLERFVRAVPSGAELTDADKRTGYVKQLVQTLMKRAIESIAETVSAYEVDADQIQKLFEGIQPAGAAAGAPAPRNWSREIREQLEDQVGLPTGAAEMQIQIYDVRFSPELEKAMSQQALNAIIRQGATELLELSGIPNPDSYKLFLRQKQERILTEIEAKTEAEVKKRVLDKMHDDAASEFVRLEKTLKAMMPADKYAEALMADTKTPKSKLLDQLDAYEVRRIDAEIKKEEAETRKAATNLTGTYADTFREKWEEAQEQNRMRQRLAAAHARGGETLAIDLVPELEEYRSLYGRVLQDAIDKTAASVDTSRISIAGLEGIGGATGLEALRLLGGRKTK